MEVKFCFFFFLSRFVKRYLLDFYFVIASTQIRAARRKKLFACRRRLAGRSQSRGDFFFGSLRNASPRETESNSLDFYEEEKDFINHRVRCYRLSKIQDESLQKSVCFSVGRAIKMETLNETQLDSNEIDSASDLRFSAVNYAVFGCMLALSALIGIYFGFFSKQKQNNTKEYLLGGKEMNFFPIAASLIASHISGATFLALPAEVYAFGSEYVLSVICAVFVSSTTEIFMRHEMIFRSAPNSLESR